VPNRAVRLPQPTHGGNADTFTLRPGIRYSGGRVVQASDIRRGVLRALGANPEGNHSYLDGIVGAAACIPPQRLKATTPM
jgi:peptide/nickel transport system substrate-binding protein